MSQKNQPSASPESVPAGHLSPIACKVVLFGGVGLGKTHLAIALAYEASLQAHAVLFATAIDVVNNLVAAQNASNLKNELKKYRRPRPADPR